MGTGQMKQAPALADAQRSSAAPGLIDCKMGILHSSKNFGTLPGTGLESYAKNSASQGKAVESLFPLLTSAVDQLKLPSQGSLVVVDLGCASGPNSLKNVDHIVTTLQARYTAADVELPLPEFQVFFQDLPSNDFNNLFHLLTENTDDADRVLSSSPKYFAAGVPGSFYDRLFPVSSVNVFFSSYSLHWMSKVPDSILDKESTAYNKGKSWIQNGRPEVGRAYKEQAASDLRAFLEARAEELRSGGLLFLLFLGRSHPDPAKVVADLPEDLWDLVDAAFEKMVSEGSLSEEQRDSYNAATYLRSLEEVTEVVDSFSSVFRVDKLEQMPIYHFADHLARYGCQNDPPRIFAKKVLLMYKATKAPQIEIHIGPELSKVFWTKYTDLFFSGDLVDRLYSRIHNPGKPSIQFLVSLIRK